MGGTPDRYPRTVPPPLHTCALSFDDGTQGDKDIFSAATSVLNAVCNNGARAAAIIGTGVMSVVEESISQLALDAKLEAEAEAEAAAKRGAAGAKAPVVAASGFVHEAVTDRGWCGVV